jgi:hypothetical protein
VAIYRVVSPDDNMTKTRDDEVCWPVVTIHQIRNFVIDLAVAQLHDSGSLLLQHQLKLLAFEMYRVFDLKTE